MISAVLLDCNRWSSLWNYHSLYVSSTGDYGLYSGGQANYNEDDNAIGRPFGLFNNNNNNQDYNNDEDDDENGNDDDQEDDEEEDNNQETDDEDKDNEDDDKGEDDEEDKDNNNFGGDYSGSLQSQRLNNEASSDLLNKFAKFNPQRTSYGGCTSLLQWSRSHPLVILVFSWFQVWGWSFQGDLDRRPTTSSTSTNLGSLPSLHIK